MIQLTGRVESLSTFPKGSPDSLAPWLTHCEVMDHEKGLSSSVFRYLLPSHAMVHGRSPRVLLHQGSNMHGDFQQRCKQTFNTEFIYFIRVTESVFLHSCTHFIVSLCANIHLGVRISYLDLIKDT